MKCHLRFVAAAVLAAVVSFPSFAYAAQPRERGAEKNPIVRLVQKVRKVLGITTHNDFPVPPVPVTKP
jgi:hypothetical protein